MLGMSCAHIPEFGLSPDGIEIASYMGNAILSSVPFDEVAGSLPGGTRTVTPEERRRAIAARRLAVSRRFAR